MIHPKTDGRIRRSNRDREETEHDQRRREQPADRNTVSCGVLAATCRALPPHQNRTIGSLESRQGGKRTHESQEQKPFGKQPARPLLPLFGQCYRSPVKRLALVVVVVSVAVAGVRYAFHTLLGSPVEPFPGVVRVDVTSGQSFVAVARRLEEAGVVPSARALALWARWKGVDRQIQQGAYRFEAPLSPLEILEKMRSGDALVMRVTIPEGATASDVARILERCGVGTEAEYRKLFVERDFVRSLGIPADAIEGYLFPETYFFSPLEDPRAVVAALTGRFRTAFDAGMQKAAEERGLSVHQVVTLASIVEKETGAAAERPLIAAVFLNRLRRGMPLQADPTVIYGIENFDGNLTRRHLETPTLYNTYTSVGLPAGPIANPGREALRAVVHPAEGEYLYFVSRNDGSHEFSRSLREHNRAVTRFQRRRGASSAQTGS